VLLMSGLIRDQLRADPVRLGVAALLRKKDAFQNLPAMVGRLLADEHVAQTVAYRP
jgi:hypothetical protein